MDWLQNITTTLIQWGALGLLIAIGILIIYLACIYVIDRTQTKNTIRRNYPILGRFRYLFEYMGVFLRRYFISMDREELPFNRAERSWAYRASKNDDTTIAFGSTRPLNVEGDVQFLNCLFPALAEEHEQSPEIIFGQGRAMKPYKTAALINISGMSYGSISKPAVLALSEGARQAGIWLNTGEGGLSSYHLEGGCDIVFQLGTAKYGVNNDEGGLDEEKLKKIAAYEQVKMFEIKLSQGAKPGKGGILPGTKVSEEIARIRGIPQGQDSISPNGHLDARSVPELLALIKRVRRVTEKPVGIKLVVGRLEFFEELCEKIVSDGVEVAPDFITIDSADGGTGAAPQPLMDYVGMNIKESLPLVVDILKKYELRQEIKVIASGKLITPGRVAWALTVGADFVVSARGFMFALGCIQAMQCNKNTCPTGVTTHKKSLQQGLVPAEKARRVANYAEQITKGVEMIAHSCGVKHPRQMTRDFIRINASNGMSRPMSEVFATDLKQENV